MRRAVALFVSLLMIMSVFSISVFAETQESVDNEKEAYKHLEANAVTFIYNYSEDAKKIEIRGNVNYNVLVSYGKYKIEILRIAPNQTAEQALLAEEPDVAASMDIAARFEMVFSVASAAERFYKYAVILTSPENERIIASEPQYVNVSSGYVRDDSKNAFKGIAPTNTAELSVSGDMGFGSAVIPVYYDRLINESRNGYIYPHEDTHVYFDKAYIDELDMKIRTYSATGAKVYLQLLLPVSADSGENSGIEYLMPDTYNTDTVSEISTYVRFLVSRYDNYRDGKICGLIVGKQIDREIYNYSGCQTVAEYADKYAHYLTVAANSARLENPEIDIVIPVSDRNSYNSNAGSPVDGYLPSELLGEIFSTLDSFFIGNFDCSVMIESESSPIQLDTEFENGIRYKTIQDNDFIGVNNLDSFEAYLNSLRGKYRSAPKDCIYYWSVPEDMFGNMLECAYSYSYYSLICKSDVKAFVISLSRAESGAIETVKGLLSNIDTNHSIDESKRLLKYFGVNNWGALISGFSENGLSLRTVYSSRSQNIWEYMWKGSFSYFDFSTGGVKDWYGGAYSGGVRTDYGTDGNRVLRQSISRASGAAHSDLFCLYEFDENFIYTPALKLVAEIIDSEENAGAVYEITVTIGSVGRAITKSYVVSSGQKSDLWLDMSEYNSTNKASYIKISTRGISGSYDEYSLRLYDVVGYSGEFDDAQLSELITAERLNIRNQSHTEDSGASDNMIYWIVFTIVLLAICLGGIMFTVIRRDDKAEKARKTGIEKRE